MPKDSKGSRKQKMKQLILIAIEVDIVCSSVLSVFTISQQK